MRYLATLLVVAGCWKGSLVGDHQPDPAIDAEINRVWAAEIRRVARDGDWILSRSLSPQGDLLSLAAFGGERISHASMVDVTNGTVIEAIPPRVREITIEKLMSRNWYVMVVRPRGMSAEEERAALARARAQLDVEFDYYGLFAFDQPDKWYCTELVYWASGFQERDPQVLLFPNELLEYGEVLYYSGRRDSDQWVRVGSAGRERSASTARR